MLATGKGRLATVRLLLDSGANPALRNKKREQAIDLAQIGDYKKIADLLEINKKSLWGELFD